MKIQVQCTDGNTSCFAMADEQRGMDLIESITPSEFFSQPVLRIQAGNRTSIFNMKAVESIYFATSLEAQIRKQPAVEHLRTISEEEYLEKLDLFMRRYESAEDIFEPGTSIETLVVFHCVSGKTYYLQVEVIAKIRVQQLMDLHNILGWLPSVIPCSSEAYIALNPGNIKRVEIYPAPRENMHTAWLFD